MNRHESAEYLATLARQARLEQAPRGDVSQHVLRLVVAEQEQAVLRPLYAFACGSLAVCVAALTLAWMLGQDTTDPLSQLLNRAVSYSALGLS